MPKLRRNLRAGAFALLAALSTLTPSRAQLESPSQEIRFDVRSIPTLGEAGAVGFGLLLALGGWRRLARKR